LGANFSVAGNRAFYAALARCALGAGLSLGGEGPSIQHEALAHCASVRRASAKGRSVATWHTSREE